MNTSVVKAKLRDGSPVLSAKVNYWAPAIVELIGTMGYDCVWICNEHIGAGGASGADQVIDYTKEDFTKNGQTYDIIFDAVGKRSFSQCKSSLNPKGIYLNTVATVPLLLQMLWTSITGGKKAIFGLPPCTTKEFDILKDLIEAGKLKTVIDKTYPLEQVAEAHKYSENGHAKGKIVITL